MFLVDLVQSRTKILKKGVFTEMFNKIEEPLMKLSVQRPTLKSLPFSLTLYAMTDTQ